MNLKQQYATKNECYQSAERLNVRKLMLHSTATKGVMAQRFADAWNTYRPNGRQVLVHAFLDDSICVQLLPWEWQAWHCGGSGNQQAIGIEVCEPSDYNNREYFEAAMKHAIEVFAYLCKQYGLDENDIISHKEGHFQGIASNHGDPDHWWGIMGYDMNQFRAAVGEYLNSGNIVIPQGGAEDSGASGTGKSGDVVYQAYAAGKWWSYVVNYGEGTEGYAGLMGSPMNALRAYVKGKAQEVGYLEYRVHRLGDGWYNWQRDRELDKNGENFAGDLKNHFDGLQMRIVGIAGKHVRYRAHCIGKGWLPWVIDYGNGDEGYAGWWGYTIDAVQVEII